MDIHEAIKKAREEASKSKPRPKSKEDIDKQILNEILEQVREHDEIARERGGNSIKRLV